MRFLFSLSPQVLTPTTLTAVWSASLVSTVLLPIIVLVFLKHFVTVDGYQPEFGPYVLALGVLVGLGALVLALRFRRMQEEIRPPAAGDGNDAALRAYTKRLFVGVGIAEGPCYVAILYYFMTNELTWTIALCVAAVFLVMLFKPRWPARG